ncbi:MAG TPA: PAS domain S-box protein [Candidatus Omnitrophota bacterium]|nr:PAS domain S-box protein [Candidatus Omnitrophota bacterium]
MSLNKGLPPIKEKFIGVRTFSLWAVGIVGFLISLTIWQLLLRFGEGQANKLLQLRADYVKNELITRFGNRGIVLQGMERRWELNKGVSKEVWDSDAALFYNHYKGLKSAMVTDASFALRWIFPPEAGSEHQALQFRDYADKLIDFQQINIRGEVTVLPSVHLNDGTTGILMCVPLYSSDTFDGLMIAVNDPKELFDNIFRNIVPGYGISVFADDMLLYTRQEYSSAYRKEWEKTASFELFQVEWKVSIWPGRERFSEVNTLLPAWVFAFGITATISLLVILYLSQLTKIRAKKIDDTNRELVYEIVERRLAEDKLKLGQERLNAILNDANAFICIVGMEGDLISISRYALSLLGIADEQTVLGKTFDVIFPPEMAAWFEHQSSLVMKEGVHLIEQKELDFKGNKIVLRFAFFPLTYVQEHVYAACCIGINEKEHGLS